MRIHTTAPIAAVILAAGLAAAQSAPSKIGYQGRLLNADGTPKTGSQTIAFRLFDSLTGGTQLWTESQTIGLTNGYYETFLGDVSAGGTAFGSTVFDGSVRYLELQVTGDSGALTPRQPIGSVPYAMRSSIATGTVTNAMLGNNAVTVTAGTGLSGGGSVVLGGSTTLNNSGVLTVGASGVLSSSGGANPSVSLSGTVPVANGGTGATTLTQYGVLVGEGSGAVQATGAGASGNLLVGQGSANPTWNALSGDATITSGGALTVTGLRGVAVAATSPSNGQLLTYSSGSTSWAPAAAPSSVPTGLISPYGGSSAPSGWLNCDGSAVSRATYSALFTAIGTTYGAGDGSTTFNLPDLRGRASVGIGQGSGLTNRAIGASGGEESHTLSSGEMPAHSHTVTVSDSGHSHGVSDPGHAHTGILGYATGDGDNLIWNPGAPRIWNTSFGYATATNTTGISVNSAATGITASTASVGSGGSHNNMQPFLALNYIIKT